MEPMEVKKPADVFKYLTDFMEKQYLKPQIKLMPEKCEVCGLPADECLCEDHV